MEDLVMWMVLVAIGDVLCGALAYYAASGHFAGGINMSNTGGQLFAVPVVPFMCVVAAVICFAEGSVYLGVAQTGLLAVFVGVGVYLGLREKSKKSKMQE